MSVYVQISWVVFVDMAIFFFFIPRKVNFILGVLSGAGPQLRYWSLVSLKWSCDCCACYAVLEVLSSVCFKQASLCGRHKWPHSKVWPKLDVTSSFFLHCTTCLNSLSVFVVLITFMILSRMFPQKVTEVTVLRIRESFCINMAIHMIDRLFRKVVSDAVFPDSSIRLCGWFQVLQAAWQALYIKHSEALSAGHTVWLVSDVLNMVLYPLCLLWDTRSSLHCFLSLATCRASPQVFISSSSPITVLHKVFMCVTGSVFCSVTTELQGFIFSDIWKQTRLGFTNVCHDSCFRYRRSSILKTL